MGIKRTIVVTRIRDYELELSGDVSIRLLNCCFSPDMEGNIISFYALYKDGFLFSFDNENGDILVYKHDCFIFKASPYDCNVSKYRTKISLFYNNKTIPISFQYKYITKIWVWFPKPNIIV